MRFISLLLPVVLISFGYFIHPVLAIILFAFFAVKKWFTSNNFKIFNKLGTHFTVFYNVRVDQTIFDAIILSPYGIFIVQRVPFAGGKLVAAHDAAQWSHIKKGHETTIMNPIMTLQQQIQQLEQQIGMKLDAKPLIAIRNSTKLAQHLPNVVKEKQLAASINEHTIQQVSYITIDELQHKLITLTGGEKRSVADELYQYWLVYKERFTIRRAPKAATETARPVKLTRIMPQQAANICPHCGKPVQKAHPKFLSCSAYPSCRYTAKIL